MKRIIHPSTPSNSQPRLPGVVDPPMSEISVARLIDDGLLILYREIKNLLALSVNGKLDAANSRDLRDHLKLLFELKAREDESLRGLTDKELEDKAKAVLKESDDGE